MPATCCPKGYNFIDSLGNFNDPYYGYGSITNSLVGDFVNKCAILVNVGTGASPITAFALPDPVEPIDCPCCPTGYTYSDFTALCINDRDKTMYQETVPCIPCVCPTPVTPTCAPCPTEGTAVSFASKNCTSCTPQNGNIPCGAITSFLAGPFQDPNYNNFKLRNKNFI
jgi:hypothetical protein